MTSTDAYWVGPTIGNGSFGQVVYGRYKEGSVDSAAIKQSGRNNDNNNSNGRSEGDTTTTYTGCCNAQDVPMGREVAIKVVDKITVMKYPYVLKGLYHERKLILELLQPATSTSPSTPSTSTSKKDDPYDRDGSLNDETIHPGSGDDDTVPAAAAADVDHRRLPSPPVIQIWASFHDSQCLYVVMELATGGDLQYFIDQVFSDSNFKATIEMTEDKCNDDDNNNRTIDYGTPQSLPPPTVQWIEQSVPFYVDQLVRAVNFIHSRHVIHCDLKPGNILLDKTTGRLVLADFSSAIVDVSENERVVDVSSSSSFCDQDHHFFFPRGTACYSSPELLKSSSSKNDFSDESSLRSEKSVQPQSISSITKEVDYWSVGCIIYCMLFGTSPFHRETEALTLDAVMEYAMKAEQECPGIFCNKSKSKPGDLPNRLPHSGKKDVSLLRDIHGLLTVDPIQRRSYWSKFCYANNDKPITSTLQLSEGVILPSPQWKDNLERYELKDGSGGWVVFQL